MLKEEMGHLEQMVIQDKMAMVMDKVELTEEEQLME